MEEIALARVVLADQAGGARRKWHVEMLEGAKVPDGYAAYSHAASSLQEADKALTRGHLNHLLSNCC